MKMRSSFSPILFILCLSLAASAAHAQWVKDGMPVGSADYDQTSVRLLPSGVVGTFVGWTDGRSGIDTDIYGNLVGFDGTVYGGTGGVPVCTAVANQYIIGMVGDGDGGMIMLWNDERGGTSMVYAQRIDGEGNMLWQENGINICPAVLHAFTVSVVSDGAGGVIAVWDEYRNINRDIYAQRVDGSGTILWGDGVAVCTNGSDQYTPKISPDGFGGAIVAWLDYRAASDIYAQRIDADGNLLWTPDGNPVCSSGGYQTSISMAPASGGGTFIAWADDRYGYSEAFVQYIDLNGSPFWETDGISVCDDAGNYNYKYAPRLAPDGSGGVIAVWYDDRTGDGYNIYGQRFDPDGTRAWGPSGVLALPCYWYEDETLVIKPDGSGGAILAVDMYVDDQALELDVFAQRLNHAGSRLWGSNGVAVSVAENYQYAPAVAPDGFGGAIIAWEDYRPGSADIYCQRISASGLTGNPAPEILSCLDLPADQGGWIRLTTRASSSDAAGVDNAIFGYNVWREIPSGGGPLAPPSVTSTDRSQLLALLSDPATATGVQVDSERALLLGLPDGEWESVGFWFATRDTLYNIAVPTKDDSTEAGIPYEVFIVTAHSSIAGVFVTSAPDTGYSVDNLAPGMTGGFEGHETAYPDGLNMTWAANPAGDMWKYNVYKGDNEFFVADGSSLFGSTEETSLFDGTWSKGLAPYYKLAAVDRHGNEGPATLLRPEDVYLGTTLKSFLAKLSGSFVEIYWTLGETDDDARFGILRSTGGAFEELDAPEIIRDGLEFSVTDRDVEPGTTYQYRVVLSSGTRTLTLFETESIATPTMPLTLHQNYPNPFNPATTISYYLPGDAVVKLDLYDAAGRLVTRLVDGVKQDKGRHTVDWRGLDSRGTAVSSGVYFYRLTVGKDTISKKMVLLK